MRTNPTRRGARARRVPCALHTWPSNTVTPGRPFCHIATTWGTANRQHRNPRCCCPLSEPCALLRGVSIMSVQWLPLPLPSRASRPRPSFSYTRRTTIALIVLASLPSRIAFGLLFANGLDDRFAHASLVGSAFGTRTGSASLTSTTASTAPSSPTSFGAIFGVPPSVLLKSRMLCTLA